MRQCPGLLPSASASIDLGLPGSTQAFYPWTSKPSHAMFSPLPMNDAGIQPFHTPALSQCFYIKTGSWDYFDIKEVLLVSDEPTSHHMTLQLPTAPNIFQINIFHCFTSWAQDLQFCFSLIAHISFSAAAGRRFIQQKKTSENPEYTVLLAQQSATSWWTTRSI